MYLYYEYSHKPSFDSVKSVPFIPRHLQVHLVKKPWVESQTTSTMRLPGNPWSSRWLALDGTDAEATPQQGTVTIFPHRPKGFVEFDVTNAVKAWSSGVPNNGLVILATNELDPGRDTRFASNANMDSSTHAFVLVRCSDGTNKQLQKQGGGWSIHKSSLMAFIFAFFVCTASALL